MKNFFKKYLWLFEFIGAAMILTLAIIVLVETKIISIVIGLVFLIFSIARIIPLVKTTDDKLLKVFYVIEFIISVLFGIATLVSAFTSSTNSLTKFVSNNIGLLLGIVLYLRGFVHFFSNAVRHQDYPISHFIINIIFITLGVFLISIGKIGEKEIAWFVFSIALVTFMFILVNGYKNYSNYRNNQYSINLLKKKSVDMAKQIEEPQVDTDINVIVDKKEDEIEDRL